MDFAIEDSAEQGAFRKEVRDWFSRNVPESMEHSVDPCDMSYEQYQVRRELGRRMGAQGWLYPSMPKEYGGGDLAAEKIVILYDELARIGLALPPYYDAGGRMAAPTIMVWGTEEHKQRFLPPICRGEVRTWQLLTEPGAGSDLAGIKTTAVRDGDAYVVNGQKIFVGSSHGADYSWTIVVTDPKGERHKNLSWLMIPMNLPGISVLPMDLLATGGEGGSGSGVKNSVFFDNVRVPADHLVGGENNGWRVATTHLEVEHGGMGRLADRRVIYEFIDYCKERRDGHAIADDPDARAGIVEMYIEAEITRLFALRNHWLVALRAAALLRGLAVQPAPQALRARHRRANAAHRGAVRADEGRAVGAAEGHRGVLSARRDHRAAPGRDDRHPARHHGPAHRHRPARAREIRSAARQG